MSTYPRASKLARGLAIGVAVCLLVPGQVLAHVGSLEGTATTATIPQWFVVLVAGVVVGASFLFTSLMADHEALQWINGLAVTGSIPSVIRRLLGPLIGAGSVAALIGVVAIGFIGPSNANGNLASLFVWVAWWGGFTITTYTICNSWPVFDPFRRLARLVPGTAQRSYPSSLGAWPAVVGLLALVWVEVVSGATEQPRALAGLIVVYAGVTIGGVWLLGRETWFDRVDPLSAVFRTYGGLAPIQRTESGFSLRLPGAALTDRPGQHRTGDVAFVLALLWATTFDGLVSTPLWRSVLEPVVAVGVPAVLGYLSLLIGGFVVFLGAYRWAARRSRASADSYVRPDAIARWLAPSLVPIAAGYHLAHFLGYVITLWLPLITALQAPLTGPTAFTVIVLPEWFGFVKLGAVLVGHLLAIWVAHSIAFDLFPGARQPIRSQYPLIGVMIGYTLVSAWVIVSPSIQTPFV